MLTVLYRNRLALLWIIMIAATSASFLSSNEIRIGPAPATMLVMALAYLKSRLLMMHFMELSTAPLAWRVFFEAWLVGVVAAILLFYRHGLT